MSDTGLGTRSVSVTEIEQAVAVGYYCGFTFHFPWHTSVIQIILPRSHILVLGHLGQSGL